MGTEVSTLSKFYNLCSGSLNLRIFFFYFCLVGKSLTHINKGKTFYLRGHRAAFRCVCPKSLLFYVNFMTNLVRWLFSIFGILVLSMCGDELKITRPHLMSACLVLIVIIVLFRLLSRKMKPVLRLFFNIMILFFISLYFIFLRVHIGEFCSYLTGICLFLYLHFCDNESGEVVLPLPGLSSPSNSFIRAGSLHSETNQEGYFQTSSPAVSPQEDSRGETFFEPLRMDMAGEGSTDPRRGNDDLSAAVEPFLKNAKQAHQEGQPAAPPSADLVGNAAALESNPILFPVNLFQFSAIRRRE